MKRVIDILDELTTLDQITNKSIVGIQFGPKDRVVIIKDVISGGRVCYRPLGTDLDLTNFCPHYKSKKQCIKSYLEYSGVEVFVFDNNKELFTWLVQNN